MKDCKIVKTVTVIKVRRPLPKGLTVALGMAAAPYWVEGDGLYVLNCALADARIFCKEAGTEEFWWGKPEALSHAKGEILPLGAAGMGLEDEHVPRIFCPRELTEALNENRTFLSRGRHRRAAYAAPQQLE